MKYNFSPIIEQRVHAKLNGIDSKQWIQGIPAAAEACQDLAVRACLEVYIKSCIEHTTDPKRDEVKAFLIGMGFPLDAVAIELLTGPYTKFLHDAQGNPAGTNMLMQVRVIGCSVPYAWHADKIGHLLTVQPSATTTRKGSWALQVHPAPATGTVVISRADVEIISF